MGGRTTDARTAPSVGDLDASLVASAAVATAASEVPDANGSTKRLVVPIQGEPVSFFDQDASAC